MASILSYAACVYDLFSLVLFGVDCFSFGRHSPPDLAHKVTPVSILKATSRYAPMDPLSRIRSPELTSPSHNVRKHQTGSFPTPPASDDPSGFKTPKPRVVTIRSPPKREIVAPSPIAPRVLFPHQRHDVALSPRPQRFAGASSDPSEVHIMSSPLAGRSASGREGPSQNSREFLSDSPACDATTSPKTPRSPSSDASQTPMAAATVAVDTRRPEMAHSSAISRVSGTLHSPPSNDSPQPVIQAQVAEDMSLATLSANESSQYMVQARVISTSPLPGDEEVIQGQAVEGAEIPCVVCLRISVHLYCIFSLCPPLCHTHCMTRKCIHVRSGHTMDSMLLMVRHCVPLPLLGAAGDEVLQWSLAARLALERPISAAATAQIDIRHCCSLLDYHGVVWCSSVCCIAHSHRHCVIPSARISLGHTLSR